MPKEKLQLQCKDFVSADGFKQISWVVCNENGDECLRSHCTFATKQLAIQNFHRTFEIMSKAHGNL